MKCSRCDYTWEHNGKLFYACCPRCRYQNKINAGASTKKKRPRSQSKPVIEINPQLVCKYCNQDYETLVELEEHIESKHK